MLVSQREVTAFMERGGTKSAFVQLKKFSPLLLAVLTLGAYLLLFQQPNSGCDRVVGGMAITVPKGFVRTYTDSRYASWEYKGKDKRPGRLILDEEIRGDYAQAFPNVGAVLEECLWLKDAELYVNPHGVRMVRGFSLNTSEYPERRYYVESGGSVFLLSMIENSIYYSPADCEEAMLQTADSIHPVK